MWFRCKTVQSLPSKPQRTFCVIRAYLSTVCCLLSGPSVANPIKMNANGKKQFPTLQVSGDHTSQKKNIKPLVQPRTTALRASPQTYRKTFQNSSLPSVLRASLSPFLKSFELPILVQSSSMFCLDYYACCTSSSCVS